jgi:transposase InsO family protein
MSPSTLYYKKKDKAKQDARLLEEINKVIEELPGTGYQGMTTILKKKMVINKKRVHRIMKENGLLNNKKKRVKPRLTDSNHKLQKYENLVKEKKTTDINQVIVGDVTAYDVCGKDYYLALLMDLHNREVVGAAISDKNNTELVLAALRSAKQERGNLSGCIHHTDSDVRYCSDDYIMRLGEYGMKISMTVGNVYENAHAESLNKTIKRQEINMSEYENSEESVQSIFTFIDKYNTTRPHSSLGGVPPKEYKSKSNKVSKQFIS